MILYAIFSGIYKGCVTILHTVIYPVPPRQFYAKLKFGMTHRSDGILSEYRKERSIDLYVNVTNVKMRKYSSKHHISSGIQFTVSVRYRK